MLRIKLTSSEPIILASVICPSLVIALMRDGNPLTADATLVRVELARVELVLTSPQVMINPLVELHIRLKSSCIKQYDLIAIPLSFRRCRVKQQEERATSQALYGFTATGSLQRSNYFQNSREDRFLAKAEKD